MTEANRENLSAGIDGELSKEELRFLLRRLDHDASMLQAWARHHVAGDSLRRQLPPLASSGFAARVMLVIDQETAQQELSGASSGHRRRRLLHWSAGGAIAAGVAVAALMITQPAGNGADRAARLTASVTQPSTTTADMNLPPSTAPAAVPTWLNANPSPAEFSQRASMTLGDSSSGPLSPYARSLSPYQQVPRYRTLNEGHGSYLLLIGSDPSSAAPDHARQAAVAQ
ncbi:MAG: sigma-E factor negative regulatory protein [Rhodanobacter sp.]